MTEQSPATRRAAAFQATREAHSTEMAEDYVELIGDLIAAQGEARLADLAENIGVTHATAAKVVQRLKLLGLVQSRPYRSIFLTADGEAIAAKSRRRHRIVFEFLCALGVEPARAEVEAEGIEHHVGAATLDLMARRTAEWGDAGAPATHEPCQVAGVASAGA
jgi:DtxR family manganese transport transcriptional regulator